MRDERVELLLDGRLYAGWEKIGITRAMDAAAGTFSLSVTDRWSASGKVWEIDPGQVCEVRIGGETVITGYVDMVKPSFAAESHTIEVQGRDKSADLVDCSAVHVPDEWRSITLLRFAQILGEPFGVTAKAETDIGAAFDLIKLQQGETALEALNRYAKMRKVLVMPDGKGGILLTRTGVKRATVELVQGQNLLDASGTLDVSERFSEYLVKAQRHYSEDTDGDTEAHISGGAKDSGVKRYRPMLIVADTEADGSSAQERATWESNNRIGKSAQGEVTVQGWRQTEGGSLWEPNLLVRVRSPWMRLSGEMLIRQVTFSKGSDGTTTKLDIVSPQAFEPEPSDVMGKKKKDSKKDSNPWATALNE